MATYTVTATITLEVEAKSAAEAEEIARNTDLGNQEGPCWTGFEVDCVQRINL